MAQLAKTIYLKLLTVKLHFMKFTEREGEKRERGREGRREKEKGRRGREGRRDKEKMRRGRDGRREGGKSAYFSMLI